MIVFSNQILLAFSLYDLSCIILTTGKQIIAFKKGTFAPPAPPTERQEGRLLPPAPSLRRAWIQISAMVGYPSPNLVLPKAWTNLYSIDTVRFVGKKLWQTLPKEIKESQTLGISKRNIKAIPLNDNCKLHETFIANSGVL